MKMIVVWLCLFTSVANACLWDSDTLKSEQHKSPEMSAVIFKSEPPKVDTQKLHDRIKTLNQNPQKETPEWWNDLGVAYVRLGQPEKCVELLEPLLTKFPDNYASHANLGTAYHLLGKYEKAEKHIARDLEINPDAHFGFEKYHLALLQYLKQDDDYQKRHLYVDEFSQDFMQEKSFHHFRRGGELIQVCEADKEKYKMAFKGDLPPAYRCQWNLRRDPKFQEGVIYMASLNSSQPACFTMLGVVCLRNSDLNLAKAAFQKAIDLNSHHKDILAGYIQRIDSHIAEARLHDPKYLFLYLVFPIILIYLVLKFKKKNKPTKQPHS